MIRHATPAPSTGVLPRSAYNEDHTVDVATQAEAEAGTVTNKLMTPQRTAQAIAALGVAGPQGATGPAGATGDDGESVTITTFTDEAAFNAATAGSLELLVLLDA